MISYQFPKDAKPSGLDIPSALWYIGTMIFNGTIALLHNHKTDRFHPIIFLLFFSGLFVTQHGVKTIQTILDEK